MAADELTVVISADFWKRLEAHMDKEDARDERDESTAKHWHIGKEVPIATLIVLILQTCSVIWWAANTAAKVDFMKETLLSDKNIQLATDNKQDQAFKDADLRISASLEKVDRKLDRIIESSKR